MATPYLNNARDNSLSDRLTGELGTAPLQPMAGIAVGCRLLDWRICRASRCREFGFGSEGGCNPKIILQPVEIMTGVRELQTAITVRRSSSASEPGCPLL